MTLKYYLESCIVGAMGFFCSYMAWKNYPNDLIITAMFIASFGNFLLFPFARMALEKIAFHFTGRDFWSRGIFIDTPGRRGVEAFYYGFVFYSAIPVGLIYIIYIIYKKATQLN